MPSTRSIRNVDAAELAGNMKRCCPSCALMDFRWPGGVYQRVDRIAGISCDGAGVSAYDVTMHAGAMARNKAARAFPEATGIVN